MKVKFLLGAMLMIGSIAYASDNLAQEIANEINSIEAEYQALLQKERERKDEFIQEKAQLEQELQTLKEKQLGKTELYEKLKKDSEVRWHRDQYKKLLKRYDVYYEKLEKKIADKEQQITELTKLLEVLDK